MALPQIGLEAVFHDQNFQAGIRRYQDGLKQATGATEQSASMMQRAGAIAGGALTVGLAAATAAIGAFVAVAKIGIDADLKWSETLGDLGDQLGLSGPAAAKWAVAFEHVGLSVEEGSMGLRTFTRGLADATKKTKDGKAQMTPFAEALKKLGLRATDAKGKLKTFDQLMPDIMDAFKKLPAGVEATDIAMELFGTRGGSKFLDFLRQGSKGLEDAREMAEQFGLEIETDGVDAAEEFQFAMNDVNIAIKGLWVQVGSELLPIVRDMVDFINHDVLPVFGQWARDTLPFIGQGLRDLGRQIGDFATLVREKGLSEALGQLGAGFWDWLTGPKGVISQVGDKAKEVAGAIEKEFKKKAPNWGVILEAWKTNFWNWLTDPKEGVLVQVFSTMNTLTDRIRAWAEDEQTIADFQAIGKKLGQNILDGMKNLFQAPEGKDNLLVTLANSLMQAARNVAAFFASIGSSIASGVVLGILERFVSPRTAADMAEAFRQALNSTLIMLLSPGGAVQYFAGRLAQSIIDTVTRTLRTFFGQTPAAPTRNMLGTGNLGTAGVSFQQGGWVPSNLVARLHAGEYVLNRQQAMAMAPVLAGATTNSYTFNHTWSGSITAADRGWIESTVRSTTETSMAEILARG